MRTIYPNKWEKSFVMKTSDFKKTAVDQAKEYLNQN